MSMNTTNMTPAETIWMQQVIERAAPLVAQGMDAVEAIKKAHNEVLSFIAEMHEGTTQRAKLVRERIGAEVYAMHGSRSRTTREAMIKYMEEASEIVAGWPEWKRGVLRGTLQQCDSPALCSRGCRRPTVCAYTAAQAEGV